MTSLCALHEFQKEKTPGGDLYLARARPRSRDRLHIKGDIEVTSYQQLEAAASQTIASGTRYLLLDLAQVGYISSAGLRALQSIFAVASF